MFVVVFSIALLATGIAAAEQLNCPAEAPLVREVEFRELWRSDPDAPEYLMGNVQDVISAADGEIYALDVQQQQVLAFDANGSFLRTMAREGEGPGEISGVWSMGWWDPGSLILPQAYPARIICVDRDGEPMPELKILRAQDEATPASIGRLEPCGTRAVVSGNVFTFSTEGSSNRRWVGIIERDGTLFRELGDKVEEIQGSPMEQSYDELASFWEWDRWAASTDGRLYVLPERERYRIDEYDAEGELVRTITRPIEPRKRSEERLQELRDGRRFFMNGQEVKIESKLSPLEPQIRSLYCVGDELWLILDDPSEEHFARIAVHAADGQLIEERLLAIPHDPQLDEVHILLDGRIAVVENAVSAQRAHFAGFGAGESDDENLEVEAVEIAVYEMVR